MWESGLGSDPLCVTDGVILGDLFNPLKPPFPHLFN